MTDPRTIASSTLTQLHKEAKEAEVILNWLTNEPLTTSSTARARFFHHSGFVHIPRFFDDCQSMKDSMADIVATTEARDTFGTSEAENTARGNYFLESAEAIHLFQEPDSTALNKAGHALHFSSVFHEYTKSIQIRNLVLELGWKDPVVPQSMYIFKNQGGPVHSHQDSTFLFTTPRQSCLGLWLALDQATLENGCLWVRPKSHLEPLRRQYKRNPGQTQETATTTKPLLVMEQLGQHTIPWEGSTPDHLLDAGFIPIECQPGDLLAFCGTLDHLSLSNNSGKQRHTFQLHMVEGPKAGFMWSESNWLQYRNGRSFMRLLE